jgi:hypothetical protein
MRPIRLEGVEDSRAMATRTKKTVTTSLPQDELAAFDQVRERQNLTHAQAVREAIRWYVGTIGRPPGEDPTPDEIKAIRRGEAEFARGECRRLEDVQRELGQPTE